ncbi:hypothetical protein PISMIDRAFT_18804 [Pisolithus microcarpus 441]|uniref:Uncharacterized protein n=1 Tax=Pisolithus microcarpus 441 TaxID=765257 RepID=A0A0C9Y5S4_9AGAM|nr:hypothetical protein PISMIDRAFT_18804 [Pisolithus microcarpus 441]
MCLSFLSLLPVTPFHLPSVRRGIYDSDRWRDREGATTLPVTHGVSTDIDACRLCTRTARFRD